MTNSILGAALQSTTGLALYPDAIDPMGIDLGDEFAPNPHITRSRPSPLMADVPGADTSNWSSAPRPTVTAWRGSGMDAYYFDADRGVWLHCLTGGIWNG